MKRRQRAALVGLSVVALVGAACQVVAGIERVEKVARSADGGNTSPDGGTTPSNDPCAHAVPDPLPEQDDDPNTVVPAFYVAVKTLNLTSATNGLDLDGVCTCDTRPEVAFDGGPSCAPKTEVCDSDGGVDNRGATLFNQFQIAGKVSIDDDATEAIAVGKRTLLIHISEWNGKPNDREIKIGVLVSPGMTDGSGCGTSASSGTHFKPGWCGRDKWDYTPGATVNGPDSLYPLVRGLGYVVNSRVVFKSESSITTFFGASTLNLGSPIMMGTLEKANGQWQLSGGVLAGRILISDLLGAIGQFSDFTSGGTRQLCEAPEVFNLIKPSLCNGVDIARLKINDFRGDACDAISTAIAFDAAEAVLGSEMPAENNNSRCSPNMVSDKSIYACP